MALRMKPRGPKTRLYLLAALLLVTGLSAALLIYLTQPEMDSDVLGYEFADGNSYAVLTRDSKQYRHDLERLGGKAAVFADDLSRWFSGLWSGKQLAYTLAFLSIGAAAICLRIARHSSTPKPTQRTED